MVQIRQTKSPQTLTASEPPSSIYSVSSVTDRSLALACVSLAHPRGREAHSLPPVYAASPDVERPRMCSAETDHKHLSSGSTPERQTRVLRQEQPLLTTDPKHTGNDGEQLPFQSLRLTQDGNPTSCQAEVLDHTSATSPVVSGCEEIAPGKHSMHSEGGRAEGPSI